MLLTAIFFLGLRFRPSRPSLLDSSQEIDHHVGNVCYAVTVADVNGDGKLDVVAVTEDSVYLV